MDKAIFIDKDGTLVRDIPYNVDPEKITFLPHVGEGLRLLHKAGYKIIVVSNQSGVARGLFREAALAIVEKRLQTLFNEYEIPLDGFYYCPHLPEGVVKKYATTCTCRKPNPGLLMKAAKDFGIDVQKSWMIGDILNDIEAGKKAGCRTILIDNGGETEWIITENRVPDAIVPNMLEATDHILEQQKQIATLLNY